MSDSVQRSRTYATLAPLTYSGNKNRPVNPHAYVALKRIASLPDMESESSVYTGPAYQATFLRRPARRDWDMYDDYWADRRYFMSPLAWPSQSNKNRRYYYFDPPYGLWWNYPALSWYPKLDNRQVELSEQIDPLYSRRYRDPSYDRPIWKPARRWPYQTGYRIEPRRILEMYRQKLIDYDALQKSWLTPFSIERKINEYLREPKEGQDQTKLRMSRASSVGRYGGRV